MHKALHDAELAQEDCDELKYSDQTVGNVKLFYSTLERLESLCQITMTASRLARRRIGYNWRDGIDKYCDPTGHMNEEIAYFFNADDDKESYQ